MQVRALTRRPAFQDITFDLYPGEILGLGGLMGAGRTELMRALYGLEPAHSGEILLRGKPVTSASPSEALRNGIALVSEDRQQLGLFPRMSVRENISIGNHARYSKYGWIDRAAERSLASRAIAELGIKTPDPRQPIRLLSGGNQQKALFARALLGNPDILILDEPTRGIDIGAKAEIYRMIGDLAESGKAILLVSSELPELLALSHRILVLRGGRVTAQLEGSRTTQAEIMQYAIPD
jgi:ABC-type sugar transport system ATPase subunit